MESAIRRIGFIGVGSMGSRMARRLHEGGFDLTVCDREPAAVRSFAALGTRIAPAPSACGGSDLVILMVANDAQLREAVLAPDGLSAGIDAAAPPLVAVMATVLPDTVRDIAGALSRRNAAVIDAPVSGGLARAEAGTLTVMLGGDPQSIARAQPVLERMAGTFFHCGELGSGQLAKIVNNMMGVSNLFLMAEAMTLAKRYGLEPERLASIMEASSGRSAYSLDWEGRKATYSAIAASGERMRSHLAVCRKDLKCALTLANDAHLPLKVFANIESAVAAADDSEFRDIWQQAFA